MDPTSPESGSHIKVTPHHRPNSGVAIVTIDRPETLNSFTRSMLVDLASAFRRLDADPSVFAVVLHGAGSRAFCTGADMNSAEEIFKGDVDDPYADPVAQMDACRKPIIAAVNGFAVTGGLELVLACDVVVAGRDAAFIDTHAKFGVFPSWGLSQRLPRVVDANRTREMALTGMTVTAATAEKWGFLNHVVDNVDRVLEKAIEVAEAMAKNSREFVLQYKSVINDGLKMDLAGALSLEKERARRYYKGMSREQFEGMHKFIKSRRSSNARPKL